MLRDNSVKAQSWDEYNKGKGRIIEIEAIIGYLLALREE
jgi:hypothetical protein